MAHSGVPVVSTIPVDQAHYQIRFLKAQQTCPPELWPLCEKSRGSGGWPPEMVGGNIHASTPGDLAIKRARQSGMEPHGYWIWAISDPASFGQTRRNFRNSSMLDRGKIFSMETPDGTNPNRSSDENQDRMDPDVAWGVWSRGHPDCRDDLGVSL